MRCALFIPVFVVATVIFGFLSSICALFDRSGRLSHYFARYWSRFIFWGVGIRAKVSGSENIPKDQAVIFAANHQSTMDIPAMFGYLPVQFRIMAKRSLFLVPFLGWHLYLAGNVPIDRKNPRKAKGSVFKAAARVKRGISLLIFAEGTRTRNGALQRFKRGGFILARKLQVPIVPVAIKGTFELMPAGAWLANPGRIELVIRPPIPASDEDRLEDTVSAVRRELLAAGLMEGG